MLCIIDVISINRARKQTTRVRNEDTCQTPEGRRPLQVLLALQFPRNPARLLFVTRAAYPLRPQRAIRKIGCRILASRWGQDVVVVFVRALAFARGGSTRRVGESSEGKFPPLPKTCLGSFFCAWRLEWLSHIL